MSTIISSVALDPRPTICPESGVRTSLSLPTDDDSENRTLALTAGFATTCWSTPLQRILNRPEFGPLPLLRKMVSIMSKRYPPEVREKAVRLVLERLDEFESPYAAAKAIGPLVDVHYETLRVWMKKALAQGSRAGG